MTQLKKVAVILGTRPEIIKQSPVIRALLSSRIKFFIIHTNQHYTAALDRVFFRELRLPKPKYNLRVGSRPHGEQTSIIITAIEKILVRERPSHVIVQGDTNSVLAGALAASKIPNTRIVHVEAGLRSYDRTMPEEINRVVTDHVSDILLAPTTTQFRILRREGIRANKIFVVGNTVVDALKQHQQIAAARRAWKRVADQTGGTFGIVTLHRPGNVDDKRTLTEIIRGLGKFSADTGIPLVFPVHPRTKRKVDEYKITLPIMLHLIPPVGYLDFLDLLTHSRIVFTDSGGVQEEACILRVPCVTIRNNTERPETVKVGGNTLAGLTAAGIAKAGKTMLHRKMKYRQPFGDGRTGRRVIKILRHV